MGDDNSGKPGLLKLVKRVASTGAGALQNRAELLALEWREERARLAELLIWALGVLLLGLMGLMVLTGVIIFLFPENLRVYVAGAFALLYLCGAVGAWFGVKALLKHESFNETIDQINKDRLWLDSLK
jgi:uncharacterized membrane protein YqjE